MKNIKKVVAVLILIVLVTVAITISMKKNQVNIEMPAEEDKAMAVVGDFKTFEYTGGVQTYTVPVTGVYQLEALGAQGGNRYYSDDSPITDTFGGIGGKGGYISAEVNLEAGQVLYVYVGQMGDYGNSYNNMMGTGSGGYNGGGTAGGNERRWWWSHRHATRRYKFRK